MEGFTLVDGIVAVVVVLSAVLAYSRGFVRRGAAMRPMDARLCPLSSFAPMSSRCKGKSRSVDDFLAGSCGTRDDPSAYARSSSPRRSSSSSLFTPIFSVAGGGIPPISGMRSGTGVFLSSASHAASCSCVVALVVYEPAGDAANPIQMVDERRNALPFSSARTGSTMRSRRGAAMDRGRYEGASSRRCESRGAGTDA